MDKTEIKENTSIFDEDEDDDVDDLSIFDDAAERAYKKYDGKPVDPPLCGVMGIDVVANDKGEIWIMHDTPFKGMLNWVEYDLDDGGITFVKDSGIVQDLGMKIQQPIRKVLKKVNKVFTMCIEDGKIQDFSIAVLAIRKSGILYKTKKEG